ncbi:MAG: ribonuclease P protein component [Candidatus Bostrichicola ureolyticus]|nr:MAG: ribonuclease P protein component [Candidatus Bostrichicola ureolyticus]
MKYIIINNIKFIIKYNYNNNYIIDKKNFIKISVSKLNLKKAVSRNRIKRLIKASLLCNNNFIKKLLFKYKSIILIYIDNKIPRFSIINQCIINLLSILDKLK